MESPALLLIDLQNDYFPGGKMELVNSEAAVAVAAELLTFFRERQLPVIHVQHLAVRPGATFFLPGTPGAEIHPTVQPLPDETVIQKNFPNSFRETGLLAHLQQGEIRSLVVAGMMTHMCLDAGVRAATDYGYACWVAADACATRDLKFGELVVPAQQVHAAFLAALQGAYARVMPAAGILEELAIR